MKGITFSQLNGSGLRIGIAVARWNSHITEPLLASAKAGLQEVGVREDDITILEVPGSFELPYAAAELAQSGVDAVIAIGCLIKGETMHFEYIADAVSHGLMRLNVEGGTPVIFGVLACFTEEQAVARSSGEYNHGRGWGLSAVEMALIKKASKEK
jgi:6,7-dimethyl-8-ribityllumazine synthase